MRRRVAWIVAIASFALVMWLSVREPVPDAPRPPRPSEPAGFPVQDERWADTGGARVPVEIPVGTLRQPGDGTASVSGRLLVQGVPPTTALEVRLTDYRFPELLTVLTDEAGAFRFEGLPETWFGMLIPPPGYEARDDAATAPGPGHGLRLHAPVDDLTVDLAPVPAVVGRVVDAESGRPLPGAWLSHSAGEAASGAPSAGRMSWVEAGADGRFRIEPARRLMTLTVHDSSRRGGRALNSIPWRTAPVVDEIDFGDVSPHGVRTVRVEVRDAAGAPIAGARLSATPPVAPSQAITDGDGNAVLSVPDVGRPTATASAPGFWRRRIALADADDGLAVTLLRENELLVEVVDPGGAPLAGVPVDLVASYPPLAMQDERGVWLERDSRLPARRSANEHAVRLRSDEDGQALFPGVLPNLPVRLVSPLSPDRPTELAPLGVDERRVVALILERPVELRGRVVDPEGLPVSGAQVSWDVGGIAETTNTDVDGRFGLPAFDDEVVDLRVTSPRFPPFSEAVRFPRDGSEREIQLEPGHFVRIEAADASGRPVPVRARAFALDGPRAGQYVATAMKPNQVGPLAPGRVRIELFGVSAAEVADLPRAYVEHDSSVPILEVRLPEPGSLVIAWTSGSLPMQPQHVEVTHAEFGTSLTRWAPPDRRAEWTLAPGRYSVAHGTRPDGPLRRYEVTIRPNEETALALELDGDPPDGSEAEAEAPPL